MRRASSSSHPAAAAAVDEAILLSAARIFQHNGHGEERRGLGRERWMTRRVARLNCSLVSWGYHHPTLDAHYKKRGCVVRSANPLFFLHFAIFQLFTNRPSSRLAHHVAAPPPRSSRPSTDSRHSPHPPSRCDRHPLFSPHSSQAPRTGRELRWQRSATELDLHLHIVTTTLLHLTQQEQRVH